MILRTDWCCVKPVDELKIFTFIYRYFQNKLNSKLKTIKLVEVIYLSNENLIPDSILVSIK